MMWSEDIDYEAKIKELEQHLIKADKLINDVNSFIDNHGHIDIGWFPIDYDIAEYLANKTKE